MKWLKNGLEDSFIFPHYTFCLKLYQLKLRTFILKYARTLMVAQQKSNQKCEGHGYGQIY